MHIKHILVPSDFSDTAQQALINALYIASRHRAKITLLHIVTVFDDDPYNPKQVFPDLKKFYHHLEERAGDHFQETLSSNKLEDVHVEYAVRRGFSPYEEILAFAADQNVDLISLGTHGRKPIARFFLGSVAENIVHHAKCPVLTAKMQEREAHVPSYERILVPIDFSDQSIKALELACQLLAQDGVLYVLHVVEDAIHPAYFGVGENTFMQILPDIKEKAKKRLSDVMKEKVPDAVQANIYVKEGQVAATIIEYADQHAFDLIVMGTHGMNTLGQIIIGSHANRVLRKASCPVITIK